jgi:quinoprotein glucose dehydrogenase
MGKKIDAVAVATKHGFVFVFNRETGEPVFPIEEKPFPASEMPGEMPRLHSLFHHYQGFTRHEVTKKH